MKKSLIMFLGLFVGVAITFLGSQYLIDKSEAQRTTSITYEYAIIKAIYTVAPEKDKVNLIIGETTVCFFNSKGCREENYQHELNYSNFLQINNLSENFESRKIASTKAAEIAFQKTVSSLGKQGYEMISDPKMDFQIIERSQFIKPEVRALKLIRSDTNAIYFKKQNR